MTTVDATDQITDIMIIGDGGGRRRGWTRLDKNLNHGTKGQPLWIIYKNGSENGITNILVVAKGGWIGTKMRDYEVLEDANLNKGNDGAPLTLAVSTHAREGTGKAITELYVQLMALDSNGPVGSGWKKLDVDLNLKAKDGADPTKPAKPIYLWYRLTG